MHAIAMEDGRKVDAGVSPLLIVDLLGSVTDGATLSGALEETVMGTGKRTIPEGSMT
jgi:hypothetical protein